MPSRAPQAFKQSDKTPLVVVLDHVRSLNNVGSVFRTSDAFRVESIYLCGITACPPNAEIHKTALGAEDTVDWHYYADTLEAVDIHNLDPPKFFFRSAVHNAPKQLHFSISPTVYQ